MTDIASGAQAHGVRIDAQPGHASIALNGHTLDAGVVTGYVLEHSIADTLPLLVLHTRHPDNVAFDGLARVAVAVPQQDHAAVITDFLEGIDAEDLENAALNRDDLGSGRFDLTRSMLRQLADAARGGA